MNNILKLVLTDHWFDEIKSGRKTHEYRKVTPFWIKRFEKAFDYKPAFIYEDFPKYRAHLEALPEYMPIIEFQKAYRKNPDRISFRAKALDIVSGLNTDLKCAGPVFDITLGEKLR